MKTKIKADLKTAMKNKNNSAKLVLRNIIAEITKVEINNIEATDVVIIKIIKSMIKQQNKAADMFKSTRTDLYDNEIIEIRILKSYLPAQISIDELTTNVVTLLTNNNITDKKMFGRAMGLCMKEFSSVADGNTIKSIITEYLK